MRYVLLILPFCGWGSRGSGNLPKVLALPSWGLTPESHNSISCVVMEGSEKMGKVVWQMTLNCALNIRTQFGK